MKYGVWCRVSGGVTGTREGWLKSDGARQEFDTEKKATEEAIKISNIMNGNSNRTANFNCTALPLE